MDIVAKKEIQCDHFATKLELWVVFVKNFTLLDHFTQSLLQYLYITINLLPRWSFYKAIKERIDVLIVLI